MFRGTNQYIVVSKKQILDWGEHQTKTIINKSSLGGGCHKGERKRE